MGKSVWTGHYFAVVARFLFKSDVWMRTHRACKWAPSPYPYQNVTDPEHCSQLLYPSPLLLLLFSNCEEALVVCELVEHYYRCLHLPAHHIGVITPYWAQAGLIRQQITFICCHRIRTAKIPVFRIRIQSGQWIRIRIRDPDPRGQKWPTKVNKIRNFMSWSAGCALLRTEGFFFSLDVLSGGLGIGKL